MKNWNSRKFILPFGRRSIGYLTRLVGTSEAEDLIQEVFIKVEKAIKTFCQEAQLSTWLYRIATNAAIDRMRQPYYRRELNEQSTATAEPTGMEVRFSS